MKGRQVVLTGIVLFWFGFWAVSAELSEIPVLTGNWTGTSVGHYKVDGYINDGAFDYVFAVMDQKGRVFNGTLFETGIHGNRTYDFSGVINHDMKTFNVADYDSGYYIGYLTGSDSIELTLLVEGSKGLSELCTLNKE